MSVCLMWPFLEHVLSFVIRSCPRCWTDMFVPVSFYLTGCFPVFSDCQSYKVLYWKIEHLLRFLKPIDRRLLFSCLSWTAENSFLRAKQTKLLQFPFPTKYVSTLLTIIGTLFCAFYHLKTNLFCSNFLSDSGSDDSWSI